MPVDATAASAADARVAALAEGTKTAYRMLLQRLTPRDEWNRLPAADKSTLDTLVLGIEIEDEHTSTTRYLAKLTVAFRSGAVTAFLSQSNLPYSVTKAAPALVLPVYQDEGKPVLWADGNPWREAWAALDFTQGLRPLVSPLGDLEDMNAIDAEAAVKGDSGKLLALAQRYGAGEVLVAVATPSATGLDVTLSSYGGDLTLPTLVQSFPGSGPAVMSNAATLIAAQLEEKWKEQTLVQGGATAILDVRVRFTNLDGWLAVRRRLAATPAVRAIDLKGLTTQEADASLTYQGSAGELGLALAQSGLTLGPADPASPTAPRDLGLGQNPAGALTPAPAAGTQSPSPPMPAPPTLAPTPAPAGIPAQQSR